MKKIIPFLFMVVILVGSTWFVIDHTEKTVLAEGFQVDTVFTHISSVDHSKFEELQQAFNSGPEVTEACLSCHNGRGQEVMQTAHWLWSRDEYIEGKGVVSLGKRNVMNNFCIGTRGNEATCTRCHIGYGFADQSFDFTNEKNIDCLVCHDNTGDYKKEKGKSGHAKADVNLSRVAQHVGMPQRQNCGVCHFWGGGGNNVKHGDLDKAMLDCTKEVDVHMATDGMNMTCVDCHETERHNIPGKLYALSSENINRLTCEKCHTESPHTNAILNEHNFRVACQTCHIPAFAKANATKMIWDWSTAGELDEEGHPVIRNDQDGNHKYMSIKGTFIWDKGVEPDYVWFNGTAGHHLLEDKIDTSNLPLVLNPLKGEYCSKDSVNQKCSKIWPVKIHKGKQIYDPNNLTLIQAKLWSEGEGEGAFWNDFDWDEASKKGMENVGLAYSGEYDFIPTMMYWPVNHMVAPKEESLDCKACHRREESRIALLDDFYLPGRDRMLSLDRIGLWLIILSIVGVFVHALIRVFSRKHRKTTE